MHFLFIEILDTEIIELFAGLRQILSEKESSTPIHITIKGPQKSPFKAVSIKQYMEEEKVVLFSGFGVFEFSSTYFVHAKAQIDSMEKYKLWNKPTFQDKKNPHITLCETRNKRYANLVREFLNKEIKDLLTVDFKFVQYKPKQKELFVVTENRPKMTDSSVNNLIQIGKVRSGIFERAKLLKHIDFS